MGGLIDTNFQVPEEVVLNFIKSSYQFCKRWPIGSEEDTDKCLQEALSIVHHYTYLKFHPYSDHRSGMNRIKDIKQIESVELINKKETRVLTKKNQSITPAYEFTLRFKNRKWKIINIRMVQGQNNYYSVFLN